ncbi:integral membrane protein GPR155 [Galendromus occidentalis]|uniref:Integral membrane protein GPR155 n=1 Tax=Galendromus occidentalis TaxID=34638 RepID=A0AAJ6VWK0_9ACAR|nr:integral membrane protein GPR155 [Galendromus occidentalis]
MLVNTTTPAPMPPVGLSTAGTFAEIYEKLLPVLLQCFVIVALGYISGRTRLIPQSDTKGLQLVVSYFFLPALVFRSLVTIDFYTVNYRFLASILIGKLVIFGLAAILTWLLKRKDRVAFAGLFGIFCSMSNDFALGYPLVSYLYEKDHPEFSHYLYLIAPIQLLIINPIGFVLMEYGRLTKRQIPSRCRSKASSHYWKTILGILKNPIMVMTAAGIVGNFAFKQKLPRLLEVTTEPLGAAFSASALYLLGQNMVGGFSSMCKYTMLTTTLIVSVKVLAAPILIREIMSQMGIPDPAYTDFGFLYGMLPPAPTVAIFAAQFCLPGEAVSAGVVVGTFVSAPLIFITATMSKISESSQSYQQTMVSAISYTSLIALPLCLWTLFVLIPKKHRITHSTAIWLLSAQTLTCIGGIMLFWAPGDGSVFFYVHTSVSLAGIFASRIWTAMIATILMLCHERSLCFVLKIRSTLLIGGSAASLIATLILLAGIPFGSHLNLMNDPNFHLGRIQAGVALIFLIISFLVTMYGLVRQQRFRSREEYEPLFIADDANSVSPSVSNNISVGLNDQAVPQLPTPAAPASSCANCSCYKGNQPGTANALPDLEDFGLSNSVRRKVPRVRRLSEKQEVAATASSSVVSTDPTMCGPTYHCTPADRKTCISSVKQYLEQVHPGEEVTEPDVDLHQNFRHVCLLLMLLFSMMIGIAVSLWQLLTEKPTGILLELEFLDIILNYGQGILTFIVFGADASWLLFPYHAILKFFCKSEVSIPAFCELSPEVKQLCEQFRIYHLEIFANDVWPGVDIENVKFSGQQMCDWLCMVGLSHSRDEAVTYGRTLLEGRTIVHVSKEKHFEDDVHLYQFLAHPPCAVRANSDNFNV